VIPVDVVNGVPVTRLVIPDHKLTGLEGPA
jgi:hypothetical protein